MQNNQKNDNFFIFSIKRNEIVLLQLASLFFLADSMSKNWKSKQCSWLISDNRKNLASFSRNLLKHSKFQKTLKISENIQNLDWNSLNLKYKLRSRRDCSVFDLHSGSHFNKQKTSSGVLVIMMPLPARPSFTWEVVVSGPLEMGGGLGDNCPPPPKKN